jgi:guanylate kinase
VKKSIQPYLVVISAPSGAGKTTLCQRLLSDFPDLVLSISCTTRQPRGQEQNGKEYFFLTREEFEKKIQDGRFAEWAQVHGNYYGTSKDVIESSFQQNKSVLLDIDVQGAEQLQKVYPNQCFRIFISPPSLQELEFRLRARGTDSEETIQKRLINAKKEIDAGQTFDVIVVNDSLERAYSELKTFVESKLHLQSKKVKPNG